MTNEIRINKEIVIPNKLGLHIRASSQLVEVVSQFPAKVTFTHAKNSANGKSIMGIMGLAASQGSTLIVDIVADGQEDADNCWQAIANLINNNFNENQETH
jgi:phosphocarrier protein